MRKKSLITKIIILLIAIIIIFWILIKIITSISNYLNRDKIDETVPEIQEQINNLRGKFQLVSTPNELYQVKTCLLKYYLNYSAIFNENTITQLSEKYDANEYKKNTFNMLSPKYILKNNITVDNIGQQGNIDIAEPEIEIYYLYSLSNYDGLSAYFVNGKVRDSITHLGKTINAIVVLDDNNQTFEIYFNDYTDDIDYSTLTENSEINFELYDSIENRGINKTALISSKYEEISEDYFNIIRGLLLYDSETAYNLLTDDAKKKYNTNDSFKNFIDSNYKSIFLLTYGSYYLKNNDGSIAFKVYDKDNNICITIYFNEFSSFKFDIDQL